MLIRAERTKSLEPEACAPHQLSAIMAEIVCRIASNAALPAPKQGVGRKAPPARDPAFLIFPRRGSHECRMEVGMRRIILANIDRFNELLKAETDPTKRALLTRLLAEEKAKLMQSDLIEKKPIRH
jgi:hypothetical protein